MKQVRALFYTLVNRMRARFVIDVNGYCSDIFMPT